MSKLSQVERTAMESASRNWPTILQRDAISGFEAGWLAARDYGKERERVLRSALDGLFDAARPYYDEDLRKDAEATSPGELEGQSGEWRPGPLHSQRCLRGMANDCPACKAKATVQPDHGPGDPSDPKLCTYCGESFPAPVELHHAESDCAGPRGESNG